MDSQTSQEIDEVVGEPNWMGSEGEQLAKMLPESPASVNVRVYIDGFAVQFTMRSTDVAPLITEANRLIRTGRDAGWKPSWKEDDSSRPTQPPVASTQPRQEFHKSIKVEESNSLCSIHGEKLYRKEGQYGVYYTHGWQENGYWMNCNGKTVKQGKPVS